MLRGRGPARRVRNRAPQDRKRKHAAEMLDTARAPCCVSLENDFGVAVRKETKPFPNNSPRSARTLTMAGKIDDA